MYSSRWETAKVVKQCSGCDVHMLPGSKYLLSKFSLPDSINVNLSRLVTVYLCERCLETFADLVDDDLLPENDNDDNPEPPRIA